jgi:hypothetical protein
MTFRTLLAPFAVALLLAGSVLPASAAIFGSGNVIIQLKHREPIDPSTLSPAQLTQLEDQCRERQIETGNDFDEQDGHDWRSVRVTDAYCNSIGLP